MIVTGNYILNLKINDIVVPIEPQKIEELTITQDIDRFLPVFRLRIADPTNALTHVIPFDKELNTVSIEIARGASHDNLNEFHFLVKRRVCDDEGKYEIAGILDVNDLFSSTKCRSLTGNVRTNLNNIAIDEMQVSEVEIGKSLDYDKTIIQPHWTNGKLLKYLKNNLIGVLDEAGYVCFIKSIRGKTIFVFKSLNELYLKSVEYKFIVGPDSLLNYYPVSKYKIFDNSELVVDYSGKTQGYKYFDYDTGEYVSSSISIDEFPSLSQYFLINKDDTTSNVFFLGLGRNNNFTSDFNGKIRNNYYSRTGQLIGMWISTYGLENISPGDIVQVVFGEMFSRKQLFMYQHAGLWMVKRVVHMVGQSFLTNLLLIRNGIDTDESTTLIKAVKQRKL